MRDFGDPRYSILFDPDSLEKPAQKVARLLQPWLEAWSALECVPSYIEQNARLAHQESLEQFLANLPERP